MPYKDPEKRKEAQRKSMQRLRGSPDNDVNPIPVNPDVNPYPKGYLHIWKDGKKVLYDEVPEGYKVLSDGQLWKPDPVIFRDLS